jgi:hypothetical protein
MRETPQSAEAKMSNVVVTGDVSAAGEFLWSEDIGFQMIALPKKQDSINPGANPKKPPTGAPNAAAPLEAAC